MLRPLWLDTPLRPDAPRRRSPATLDVDLLVVGGGFTGLWTAVRAVERNPGRCGPAASRPTASPSTPPAATAASARRASPTARPTAAAAGPTSTTRSNELGLRNLDEIERDGREARHRLRVRARRHPRRRHPPARGRRTSSRDEPGFLDRDAVRAEVDSPTYLGRSPHPHVRARRPGPAGLGPSRARPRSSASRSPRHPASVADDARRPASRRSPHGGARPRAPRRARDQRLPPRCAGRAGASFRSTTTCSRPSRSPTTSSPRSGWDPAHRHLRLGQPVPLLPGHARPPDPLGRLRRDLPLRALDRAEPRSTARRRSRRSRATSPTTFPQLAGHPVHPPVGGRDRHLDPVLRLLRHRPPRPRRVRHRLHRPRRRRHALRRRRDARPARRRGDRAHPARDGAQAALPFPPEPVAWLGIDATRRSLARDDHRSPQPWLRSLDRLGLGFDS